MPNKESGRKKEEDQNILQLYTRHPEGVEGSVKVDGRLFVYSVVIHERRTVAGTDRMAQKERRGGREGVDGGVDEEKGRSDDCSLLRLFVLPSGLLLLVCFWTGRETGWSGCSAADEGLRCSVRAFRGE